MGAGCAFSQTKLETQEIALNQTLLKFRQASTAEQMDAQNETFKDEFKAFLSLPGAFDYKFKHLESVAILDSPDEKIRIIIHCIDSTFNFHKCFYC